MFMVRKMAIGSSGDPVCACVNVLRVPVSVGVSVSVCHAVRCKVVINNSLHREMEQRQYRVCQPAARGREKKAVKVRNMHKIFFPPTTHTHLCKHTTHVQDYLSNL